MSSDRRKIRFGLWYDFRNPAPWRQPADRLLMPFHNPVRLAEDIATVDVFSGGRFELGVGIGFKREEFAGFGVSSKERGARTDQSLDIIRRALTREPVTFKVSIRRGPRIVIKRLRLDPGLASNARGEAR
jgi:alkanesulfonate monooxygenase SsuD/methylene tetrahydromethanopterin reductase-like flavin-dependent oxidoreductase (luciferase family)